MFKDSKCTNAQMHERAATLCIGAFVHCVESPVITEV